MGQAEIQSLKTIFTEIAGEDKIIDRNEFKKALHIHDENISNRLFDLFDNDNSGTLELEEFLSTVHYLQDADDKQKLKFAFDLYDFDGSGTIEESELCELIKSGLTENNLTFSEDQITDLTHLMFSEVDLDNSGEISFDEFQDVAQKYPDLVSGMTVSPVSWLKPKDESTDKSESKPNMIVEGYNSIKKSIDQKTFIFYSCYLMINMYLFINAFTSFKGMNINQSIVWAEAFGAILNFNGAIILLPMLRHFITKLRNTVWYNYIPIDDVVSFHRFVGHIMFFSALAHGFFYISNFSSLNHPLQFYLFDTLPGVTGLTLTIILTGMWTTALPSMRKGGHFKLFYLSHLGYGLWLVLFLMHGPIFWKWLFIPGVLFLLERWIRSNALVHETTIYDASLLPSTVLGLYMNKPESFSYKPGDYLYLKCPEISEFEWHPFTISSAPEDGNI